jgi:hypothetical protein
MTWVIEDLIGTKNGSNVNFTISHTPIAESMMIVHSGIRQVRVAVNPTPGEAEYGVSGTAVKMGIAPASSADVWTRYFY